MNYLFAEKLAKNYGDKTLFDNVDLHISKGQKVGLIARNGTGKTTLLRIIAGMEEPDSGRIERHPEVRIGFLQQNIDWNPEATVLEAIFQSDNENTTLIRLYEETLLAQQINPTDEKLAQKLQKITIEIDQKNLWDYEIKVKEILHRLDIQRLEQTVATLSGGQKKRIALAQILVEEPDFMILDEPTNHLDIGMIEWLEQYLSKSTSTLIIVTHDRYFLDKVTNEIVEIDEGESFKYKGGYAYYLEKKEERHQNVKSQVENAQRLYKRELEWMRRQPKARTTKAKSRVDSFSDTKAAAHRKIGEEEVKLSIKMQRMGSKILEFKNVCKSFGDIKIMDKFTYKFSRFERAGVVGVNGSGKTTFLNLITEKEPLDSGKIITGETIKIGYFTQSNMKLNDGKRIIETVRDVAEYIELNKGQKLTAVQLLERFLFPREMHYNYVSLLSGGEKRRLHLLTILMKNPNFLILDEPTNDLDLMTLNVLEDFLLDFSGCLLVVTHDRYFMDKMVDHIFVFEGNGVVRDFPGNYTQYRLWEVDEKKRQDAEKAALAAEKTKNTWRNTEKSRKLSYKERKEFDAIEVDMETLEEQKSELEGKLTSGGSGDEIREWSQALSAVLVDLEAKENRWLELSEFA